MPSSIVRIAVAPDAAVAAMWQDVLEQGGIRSVVRNRDGLSVAYGVAAPTFSCELLVTAEDAVRAADLLADVGVAAPR